MSVIEDHLKIVPETGEHPAHGSLKPTFAERRRSYTFLEPVSSGKIFVVDFRGEVRDMELNAG
jgi:hypothetical protein